MRTPRQEAQAERDRIYAARRLKCTKCGIVMRDYEPAAWGGEFIHHYRSKKSLKEECPNAGKTFRWDLEPVFYTSKDSKRTKVSRKGKHVSGIVQLLAKRDMRARRRGARLASKHRPK